MHLYYEILNKSKPPSEQIYLFILSSDSVSSKIKFHDKEEKALQQFTSQVFKTTPFDSYAYDATSHIWTILGSYGRVVIAILESSLKNGALRNYHIHETTELEYKVARSNLKAKPTEKLFNEEDFFYSLPTSTSNDESGDALYKALSSMLNLSIDKFKSMNLGDLKRIYRKSALIYHPDRNNGDGSKMSELNRLWSLYNKEEKVSA